MPWVGFERTIPVFEPEKTVHASDRAAIVIGSVIHIVFRISAATQVIVVPREFPVTPCKFRLLP
jgi:hypothetical protein